MRPRTLDEILGQDHLLGPGKLLRRTIESDRLTSLILYGPPGTGKTTLALVISGMTEANFVSINAVLSNVAEMRKIQEDARRLRRNSGRRTVLFIDEIHRFNKAQQDILMPDVEHGGIILIGATTENPSFSIRGPLLSRSLVCELKPLAEAHVVSLLERALADTDRGFGTTGVVAAPEALAHLAAQCAGDARRALNALEIGMLTTPPLEDGVIHFDLKAAEESCQKKMVQYDWDGDFHYDTISAFIKSLRGSDVDAALYWLAKMIYAGEDPRFIVRRLLIFASEDIGNADPQALVLASGGMQALEFVGMPEGRIILSQLVSYLALAPKSNASIMAIDSALNDVKEQKVEQVPPHLRDAHYPGAKKMGHGEGYIYPHNNPHGKIDQIYLPRVASYYKPRQSGFEKELFSRLQNLKRRYSKPPSSQV
ncbi:MAG: Replication-associated recombination protein A [Candidatus Omnitrophica bacterium ADurb.Bin277]|nr:MAG: Replication-associated recombination protein A [Candidatus Omnitrophica bacterium ADurb.Bin277]